MPRKKTHDEFLSQLKGINPNVIPLEIYKSASEPILCKCVKDNYEWRSRPADLLSGKGCPKCAGNIKKTHEEFLKEMQAVNNNIEIKSKYINAKSKILCKCKIDGHEWNSTANMLLRGSGCPVCGKHMKMSHEDFMCRISKVNPDIEIMGRYINSKTNIACRCKKDGYVWNGIPAALLAGRRCMMCAGKIKKTQESFTEELHKINPNITIIGKYINYETKILCKCNIDGNEWYASPHNLLKYKGCPYCRRSQGERMVENYLRLHNINFERQMKFPNLRGIGNRLLSYDIYVKDLNLLIEVQGRQHRMSVDYFGGEESFAIQQEHDKRKREYAKSRGISLLEIWYDDLDNINEILESRLLKQPA